MKNKQDVSPYHIAQLRELMPPDPNGVKVKISNASGTTNWLQLDSDTYSLLTTLYKKNQPFTVNESKTNNVDDDTHSKDRELLLYIKNDGKYRQQLQPIIKKIQRKIKNKTYNYKLAHKLWLHLVDNGAKKYAKEFATPKEWSKIFPPAIRKKVASYMADEYFERIKSGNFN